MTIQDPVNEPTTTGSVRELLTELARIQEQLHAEDRANGYQPSPGHNKRRADLLRREQLVLRELRHHHVGADDPEQADDVARGAT